MTIRDALCVASVSCAAGRARRTGTLVAVLSMAAIASSSCVPEPPASPPAADVSSKLFAVEIRVGPGWDTTRSAQEQAYFAEHSANLHRLREAGSLVLGARYADVGLLVLAAESIEAARAMLDVDPAIGNGTFRYDIHPFNAFYPWSPSAAGGP